MRCILHVLVPAMLGKLFKHLGLSSQMSLAHLPSATRSHLNGSALMVEIREGLVAFFIQFAVELGSALSWASSCVVPWGA
mmetsp:Transcript_154840/g.496260  ORF Transcript_154840/g.496260 Transcript_154840/m.496260 type:complete len:80 (-) Transcript_154840:54-293(-)